MIKGGRLCLPFAFSCGANPPGRVERVVGYSPATGAASPAFVAKRFLRSL